MTIIERSIVYIRYPRQADFKSLNSNGHPLSQDAKISPLVYYYSSD
jgi:hypothetical protein